MMKQYNYCLDTNIVSDILRNQPQVISNLNKSTNDDKNIFISSIVYYEIVRGLKGSEHERRLEKFCWFYSKFPHLYLDRDNMLVIEKVAEIYNQLRHGKNVEDADIFIAAMAMVNDCVLVTANEKHFERIDGLRYVNWRL